MRRFHPSDRSQQTQRRNRPPVSTERVHERTAEEPRANAHPGELLPVDALPADLRVFKRTLRPKKMPKPPASHPENPVWRGFKLDDFQVEAIRALDDGFDCLVAAHTGNGKTLIADYLVDKAMQEGRRVFYTAPIKALSNQKFRDYSRHYGEGNVGLLTGDHQINRYAPIMVMTTEIFRNMLIEKDIPGELSHVVFDEIHYLNDPERGAVWEECLILLPPHVRLLGLSATVPNIHEIADWLSHVHDRSVPIVRYLHRHVPLEHNYYQRDTGLLEAGDVIRLWEEFSEPAADLAEQKARERKSPFKNFFRGLPATSHRSLVGCLTSTELLPALYFLFSRNGCEQAARDWQGHTFLDEAGREAAESSLVEVEERLPGLTATTIWAAMRDMLSRGIAFHHAGLPPVVKQAVEEMFGRGHIRLLYATETFAVGINYPVRTVCIDSTTKFDGKSFRVMTGTEYHQMAGRAGRRGMDEQGLVIVRVDYSNFSPERFPHWPERQPEPIRSRFTLSFNSVVNLAAHHSKEQVDKILTNNFKAYQESAEIRQAQKRLERLRTSLGSARCYLVGKDACPAVRYTLDKEMRTLDRRVKTWKQQKVKSDRLKARLEQATQRQAEIRERLTGLAHMRCHRQDQASCQKRNTETSGFYQSWDNAEGQLARAQDQIDKIRREYERMVRFLKDKQYLTEEGALLPRGAVLGKLHVEELLVTEWLFEGLFHDVTETQLAALIGGVVQEESRFEPHVTGASRNMGGWLEKARDTFLRVRDLVPAGLPQPHFRSEGCYLVKTLIETANWTEYLTLVNMAEGDAIALARRTMDVLRQLSRAVEEDEALRKKVGRAQDLVARPEVVAGL
ncbi:DEAD/DEAH box helicase [Heliobacterium undosum]|uniref:DEAD/DEAH box helicase n=1 Tax=Heliomicrobium undosum TaxID=121734 RepID=A0A845L1X2_9FIRM|nr:DEAD/DEAH box helicase [Heliomicrobium undosum]MZP29626.1 DEAD/DEAH box helicase [Heliomicrobium undosum]